MTSFPAFECQCFGTISKRLYLWNYNNHDWILVFISAVWNFPWKERIKCRNSFPRVHNLCEITWIVFRLVVFFFLHLLSFSLDFLWRRKFRPCVQSGWTIILFLCGNSLHQQALQSLAVQARIFTELPTHHLFASLVRGALQDLHRTYWWGTFWSLYIDSLAWNNWGCILLLWNEMFVSWIR